MKKHQHIESRFNSLIRQGVKNAFSGTNQLHQSALSELSKWHVLFIPLAGHDDRFILRKGPPGTSHSPGTGRGHPPENKADPPKDERL